MFSYIFLVGLVIILRLTQPTKTIFQIFQYFYKTKWSRFVWVWDDYSQLAIYHFTCLWSDFFKLYGRSWFWERKEVFILTIVKLPMRASSFHINHDLSHWFQLWQTFDLWSFYVWAVPQSYIPFIGSPFPYCTLKLVFASVLFQCYPSLFYPPLYPLFSFFSLFCTA